MADKYYVVWEGHKPGVYETWEECQAATDKYQGAKFKAFKGISREEGEQLWLHPEILEPKTQLIGSLTCYNSIRTDALSVDAGTSGNPGLMEYRGVWVETREALFKSKVYPCGTNNIGEFLAIVHAMAWMKKNNYTVPIYSDSLTAMKWVSNRSAKTKLPLRPDTEELLGVVRRAEEWLKANDLSRYTLLKWETKLWGEIPADYGRK